MSTATTNLLQVLPNPTTGAYPSDNNIQALARYKTDRFTGGTSATIALTASPVVGLEQVFKNGTLLDRQLATPDYTISGSTLTLHTAPIASDVIRVFYFYRNR